MDRLSRLVQERVGEYTSPKDLWFKLESEYQGRNQDTNIEAEVNSTEDEKKEEKEEKALDTSEGKNLFIAKVVIVITLKMILKMLRNMFWNTF